MWIVCMPLYDFDVDFSQLVSVTLTVIMSNVIDDFNNIQTHFAHEMSLSLNGNVLIA